MSEQLKSYIIMNSDDNCATALHDIPNQTEFEINKNIVNINQAIPLGHKFALSDIKKGDIVKKYGHSIGIATENIKTGDWIHTHNLNSQYLIEVLKK